MYSKNSAGFVVLSDLSNSLRVCHVQWKFSSFRCHVRSFKFQKSCHVKTSNSSSVNIVNDFSNLIHVKILQYIVRLSNCHFNQFRWHVSLNSHQNCLPCAMSNLQIPKKYLSCTTEIQHCRVMLDSHIPKNICHDHIRVMLDSQTPKNVCHDHIRVMSDSQIPKTLSCPYTCHVRLTNS